MNNKFYPKFILAFCLWFFAFQSKGSFATSPIRSWATDMYNQIAIKPFSAGSVLSYPVGSITKEGRVIHSDGMKNDFSDQLPWNDFSPTGFRYNSKLTVSNPFGQNAPTAKEGEYLYQVYCEVCHGADGTSKTKVGVLRGAPVINVLVPKFSEGYLYTRITYGGPILTSMPPFGYSLSERERWAVVKYIKSKF